ncbi:MAG: alpha/beta hydrolase [Chitinophagaceae bacterium]|nr:alpha/beta hydrolase [Chitinophagaceae bacterium]
MKVIPWLQPLPKETISEYALRMSQPIVEKDPILIGLSFGGILCTEIAKLIPVEKIIIVSSIKTTEELPGWMKAVALLKLNKILPLRSTKLTAPIQNRMLGVSEPLDIKVAEDYRKNADPVYVNWAVDQVLNWKNAWVHPAIYHIHGDNDKMFPIKNTSPTYIIKDAGHFMIMNRAGEVSELINKILQPA